MVEIGRALGITTAEEFREAAAEGRLQSVPGIGPQTEQRLLAALERERKPARKGMTLNRARLLLEEIAAALDGEVAGDPRRWADTSFEFAVVCSAARPKAVLDAFASLPTIVSVVERDARRALGVTVEGVPVEVVVAEPARYGTELVRSTGSHAYVEGLGDLPDAADEESVYAALGIPWCPPELREEPYRGEPPELLERGDIRGDLHVHTTWSDGKASVLEMAVAARDLGYEYLAICDHTPNVRVVPGSGRGRSPPAGRGDCRRQRRGGAVSSAPRDGGRHPRRRHAGPSRRHPRGAGMGAAQLARGATAGSGGADEEGDGGDAASGRACAQPSEGPDHQPSSAERARSRACIRSRARDGRGDRDERAAGPPRPVRARDQAGDRGRSADRRVDGRALGARAREHAARSAHRASRLGDGRERRQYASAREVLRTI